MEVCCALADGDPVLGEFPDWSAAQGQINLSAMVDSLGILYGRNHRVASDADGQEFGETRWADLMAKNRAAGAGELHASLMAEAARFAGGTFTDDATLLVIAAICLIFSLWNGSIHLYPLICVIAFAG